MTETIPCPKHGDQPAHTTEHGFFQCRRCWYWEFVHACLGYATESHS